MTSQRYFAGALTLAVLATLSACSITTQLKQPLAKEEAPKPVREEAPKPLVERRETITATGYAVISVQQHKNAAQQRLMAIRASKLDAYRNLAEQVYGQQLDSNATVADMMLSNDTFRVRVEGIIYGARLVSITPVGEDTYETTLSLDRDVVLELRRVFVGQVAVTAR
jgi:hypothetical protein